MAIMAETGRRTSIDSSAKYRVLATVLVSSAGTRERSVSQRLLGFLKAETFFGGKSVEKIRVEALEDRLMNCE